MIKKIKSVILKNESIVKDKQQKIVNNNLLIFAKKGDSLGIYEALQDGANVDYISNGRNSLFCAISSRDIKCIKLVLDSRVDLTFQGESNMSAFQFAVSISSASDIINLLLDYPFNHNVRDIDGNTNVHYVCENFDLVKKIFAKGGKLDAKNKVGKTPFHYMFLVPVINDKKELFSFYVDKGVDFLQLDNTNKSPLVLGLISEGGNRKKDLTNYFCSFLKAKEDFNKCFHEVNQLKDSDYVDYIKSRLSTLSININLTETLQEKPLNSKKPKI